MSDRYDFMIVGAGFAGLVLAGIAAFLHARVAFDESLRVVAISNRYENSGRPDSARNESISCFVTVLSGA